MVHFIADWIFQSQRQANNKSKSLRVLIEHSSIYSLCFAPLLWWIGYQTYDLVPLLGVLPLLFVSHCFFDNRKFELWLFEKLKRIYIIEGKPFYKKELLHSGVDVYKMEPIDMGLFWILLITIDQIFHIMVLATIALIL
jgi:hypothetical protein